MTTLVEIEAVVDALPRRDQRKLLHHLTVRLEAKSAVKKPVKKLSLHDRMRDGCGIVRSGVSDLATNQKHMEGFGQCRAK